MSGRGVEETSMGQDDGAAGERDDGESGRAHLAVLDEDGADNVLGRTCPVVFWDVALVCR